MTFYKSVTPAQLAAAIAGINAGSGGKHVLNNTGVTIPAGVPVAWENNGSVALASAATTSLTDFAGITTAAIPYGQYGLVVRGGVAPGVLLNLGAVAGQVVYLGTSPGTFSLSAPTDSQLGATILQLGIAEPADQTTTPVVDLFIEIAEIAVI